LPLGDLAIVLLSALLHAVWSVAIKQSGDPLGFNFLQSWLTAAWLAPVALWIPWPAIPVEVWWLLALTAPAHALYLYWMSCAFERGDLSLVYPITRSTPAFLPLVAVPLLGESLHSAGAVGIAVVVAGIWLVNWSASSAGGAARLGSPATRYAALALAATVVYSLIDKAAMAELASGDWPSTLPRSLAYAFLLFAAHAVAFTPLVLRARGGSMLREVAQHDLARSTGAAAISVLSYSLILRALETSPVSYVVAVRQSSVLFAVALSALWLREP
jgi:uncharacterized membrane protein